MSSDTEQGYRIEWQNKSVLITKFTPNYSSEEKYKKACLEHEESIKGLNFCSPYSFGPRYATVDNVAMFYEPICAKIEVATNADSGNN